MPNQLYPPKLEENDNELTEAIVSDFATTVVPANHRSHWFTLGLLWLAMQTGFPNLYLGFTAQRQGQSLLNLMIGCALGIGLLTIWSCLKEALRLLFLLSPA